MDDEVSEGKDNTIEPEIVDLIADEGDAPDLDDAYVSHFNGICGQLLELERNSRLFTPLEIGSFRKWREGGLSDAARIIYVNLVGRKGPWFQVDDLLKRYRSRETRRRSRLGLPPPGPEFQQKSLRAVETALLELEKGGYIKTLEKEQDVDILVQAADSCLRSCELLKVVKRFSKDKGLGSRTKQGLLDALREFGNASIRPGGQTRLTSHFGRTSGLRPLPIAEQVRAVLLENLGDDRFSLRADETVLLRRLDGPMILFRRMFRLHYVAVHRDDPLSVLHTMRSPPGLMQTFKKAKFVVTAVDVLKPVFMTMSRLHQWEAATELHYTLQRALEHRKRVMGAKSQEDEESPRKKMKRETEAVRVELDLWAHVETYVRHAFGDAVLAVGAGEPLETRLMLVAEACLQSLDIPPVCTFLYLALAQLLELQNVAPASAAAVATTDGEGWGACVELNAGWVLATALREGLELGAVRDKPRRIRVLYTMLRVDLVRHRRGKMWDCLAKDVMMEDRALEAQKRALNVCLFGLMDEHVGGGDRLALARRAERLRSLLKNRGISRLSLDTTFSYTVEEGVVEVLSMTPNEWEATAEEVFLGVTFPRDGSYEPTMDVVQGKPRNCVVGVKSRFFSYDDDPTHKMEVSVERLYLEEYANDPQGPWWGVHCEGSLLRSLFSLLFFEQLFADVPGVFISPYQDAPLDLHQPWQFYANRESILERRLFELSQMSRAQVAAAVYATWVAHYGEWCRGVSWDRGFPCEVLQVAAAGLGGQVLSKAFRPFVFNMRYYSGGLPDLFLLRARRGCGAVDLAVLTGLPSELLDSIARDRGAPREATQHAKLITDADLDGVEVEAMMVEVKGPNDRLDDRQRAWLCILSNAGVIAKVGRVLLPEKKSARSRKSVHKSVWYGPRP